MKLVIQLQLKYQCHGEPHWIALVAAPLQRYVGSDDGHDECIEFGCHIVGSSCEFSFPLNVLDFCIDCVIVCSMKIMLRSFLWAQLIHLFNLWSNLMLP